MKKRKILIPPPEETLLEDEELPEGWKSVTLEDQVYIAARIGWRGLKREEYTKEGPLFLAVKDIQENGFIDFQNATDHLSEFRYDESPEIQLKNQDIIITKDGTIGKIGFVKDLPGKVTVNSSLLVVRPSQEILPRFLFFYFRSASFQKIVRERITGSAVPHLFQKDIKKFCILVPPLAEQQRIVARVESLLSHVNASRDRVSRVPLIMKKFRQAVLAAACRGRLTEGWRERNPDVKSGLELLKRLHESRKKIKKIGKTFEDDTFFEQLPELPDTWTWSTIQQTAERVTVGHVGPMKNEYRSEGIPFLRCQNVRENYFDPLGLVYISPQFHESLKKSALEPGDLVVVRSGNVGVCCIIPKSLTEANCSDLVIVKKPFGFVPKFGAYYVNSLAQKWIDLGTVGIALSHFNTKSVATLPIPIPPLAEQHEIVRRVGLLFERADAIDREVEAAGRRCERLTQAVLGKAFAGKL